VALFLAGTALLPMAAVHFASWQSAEIGPAQQEIHLWRYEASAAGTTWARGWFDSEVPERQDAWALRWAGPLWSVAMVAILAGVLAIVFERRWIALSTLGFALAAGVAAIALLEVGSSGFEGSDPALGYWLGLAAVPLLLGATVLAAFPDRKASGIPSQKQDLAPAAERRVPTSRLPIPAGWTPPAGFDPATGFFRR
jgi:hypothetical protein